MKKLLTLACGVFALNPAFATVQSPIDCHILFDGTNTVQIVWNAYPGKSYVLHTASNLLGDWSSSAPLVASSNSLAASFPVTAQAQFFKVVLLDTEGPEVLELTPNDGSIAVDRQATVSVVLADLNGINTNSFALRLGTNLPVTLADARLTFAAGRLTYTPNTNEFLGEPGAFLTNTLIAADTLGNSSTNVWSFQLALPPVTGTNIIFIGDGTQPRPQGGGLTLISTNGDNFTFSYSGTSSGLSNGVHLVKSDLLTGFTRTVVSFIEEPASHTVVVLTRPTKLAELLQSGSLAAGEFVELPGDGPGPLGAGAIGLAFDYHFNLERVLYQDANLIIGLTPASELDLRGTLDLNGNFDWFKLTSFEGVFGGRAAFTLEAYAQASGAYSRNGEKALITPVRKIYGGFIGYVPVWVELVFEINAGYELTLPGTAGYTNGFTAAKQIQVGRRWEKHAGWTLLWDHPDLGFTVLGPKWQVEATGNFQVYLQPKLTALVYSTAGAWADLKPYAELDARLQLNPHEFEAELYTGLTSTLGLDLRVWDEDWGELPDHTFTLIPRTLLWEHSSRTAAPPQVTAHPVAQTVSVGGTALFSVQAGGATPLSYRWQRDGLNLTEGGRITGTRSSTLRIANAQTGDAGNYRVVVSNPNGSATSQSATLNVLPPNPPPSPAGMAFIPAGSFTMGDTFDEGLSNERPTHTVYISAFYMDKTEVTKAFWDEVYQWAITYGYSFEYGAQGKANDHPAHTITWYDAVKWCNARSEKEGWTPTYYTSAAQTTVYRTGQLNVQNDWVKWSAGYRLPTEAEWEKAARGGVSGQRFPWGSTITHSQANYEAYPSSYSYDENPMVGYHPTFATGGEPYTSPVGYFEQNGYGLHDMAGNVWQWCWNWYGSYSSGSESDPHGPASSSYRVIRGGSWYDNAFLCRTAYRHYISPSSRYYNVGFRCVRTAGQ
ncbi:MAG: SUMF1/EgtB/PvdO family nonheme iron enzyme [Verrucomicrobiae bacterium]|nr:SUMF1/EgtB/PvdO family nonheme iron enzyme [Verrucomicrobiae bacterium]